MFKKFSIIFFLFLLNNCSAPGSAVLGPIFTGAKTGSIAQASLSYGSNMIINDFKFKDTVKKIKNLNNVENSLSFVEKDPIILVSYKIDKVDVSDIVDPEPLP